MSSHCALFYFSKIFKQMFSILFRLIFTADIILRKKGKLFKLMKIFHLMKKSIFYYSTNSITKNFAESIFFESDYYQDITNVSVHCSTVCGDI